MRRITALLTLLSLTLAAGAVSAADERARLDKGEIIITRRAIKGSDMPEATVKAVINAAPARIWSVLERCANYKKFMPRTTASDELSRKGNIIVCRITIDMPFPLSDMTTTTTAIHTVRKGFWRRAWNLLKGDFKYNKGSWTVTPFDTEGKRSMVIYKVHAEPNIPVPIWILKRASKSTLPDMIAAVAKASGAKKKRE